jgi:class 3 adenylate cyclase
VEREGKCLAYEVFGNGPCDVIAFQSCCPIDLIWELPQLASFMEVLGQTARVIVWDPRGTGASDPFSDPGAATLEISCDDALAVLDATGTDRATFFDMSQGVTGVMFAATYPRRVRSLIVSNLRSSFPHVASMSSEERRHFARARAGIESLEIENPRVAHDPVLRQWWGRAHRLLTSPELAFAQLEMASHIDVEPILHSVRTPTLVLSRRDNRLNDIETSRAAARQIPTARLVELPGSENDIFLGDTSPVLAEITQFIRQEEATIGDERPLATVLFTDIVASTERLAATGDRAWRQVLDEHDGTIDRTITAYRGRLVKTLGDGILAIFDGPARAVRCATAIRDTLAEHRIIVRAGLHTGEIELRGDDVAGIAVHITSRVSALAAPGEILVSRTVVDLTSGSGITYEARGEHELKGLPGTWPLCAAQVPASI